ncbi:ABC transporter permease [Luteococcus sp. OSA5]|uniref:ABC transporter permease n=1 Tax=unclassified Luteococcus TaxID=2639923 RepID=UPI003B42E883
MSSVEIFTANARMWRSVQADELPPQYWMLGVVVPLLFRSLVYVLLGRMIAGQAGLDWTYVGAVFLAITGSTISHTSDVPIYDVWFRTYPAVSRAAAPVVLQYLARTGVLAARAFVEAIVVCVVIGLLVDSPAHVLSVLRHSWTLLPALAACTAFGLAIIAPAIGNDSQDLIHNTAGTLVILTSGALLTPGAAPWLHFLGGVLPLQHALDAMRASLAGRSPWPGVAGELLVATGWLLVAAIAYRIVDHRTRSSGRGAMQG